MKGNTLHVVDYLIVILSLVIPVIVSLRFSKHQNNTSKYFTAGGTLPAWAIGMSILATLISSVTFLAYPGAGFKSNWILLVQGLMVPVVLLFFVRFIVPLYRNVIKLSAYEYFEKRFGFFARLYSSLGFFLAHFSKMGTVFYLVAVAFAKMSGFGVTETVIVIGVVVVLITFIGGIEAVVWLDVIQGFLLIGGGVVSLVIILFSAPGGVGAIWDTAMHSDKLGFGPFDFDFVKLTFWVMAINGIFYAIQKYGTDQTIVQRYLTARDNKGAVKASLIGVLLSVPVWALFMFIGTALYAYYQLSPEVLPDGITSEAVFPHFIMTKFPVGVIGLILSALLAAAISSLDSDLNCLAAISVQDYYVRFRPQSTEREKMLISRLVVLAAGVASVLIALYYVKIGGEGVLGIVFELYAIFSGGIAGLFLLGIFSKRANKKGVAIGIVACVLFTGYAMLTSTTLGSGNEKHLILDMGSLNFTHHKYMLGVYSHLVLFGVGWLASFLFPHEEVDIKLTWYGRKLPERNQ